jgi:dUTP pyrophosphatase
MIINCESQTNSIPSFGRQGDAGADLEALQSLSIPAGEIAMVRTGIKLDIPHSYVGFVCSRSGLAKRGIFVINAPGIIDSNYTGEICVLLANYSGEMLDIKVGMRIAQLVIMALPDISFKLTESIDKLTERGESGFGSSGL